MPRAVVAPAPAATLDGLKHRYPDASDDELLLRHTFPAHVLDDPTPEPRRTAGALDGIDRLVEAFAACEHIGEVSIHRREFGLHLHK